MKIYKQIMREHNLSNVLRFVIFIIFYILSIRSVLVYLNYLTGYVQYLGIMAVFVGLALCWWKTVWALYLFIAFIPLISGIQESGFMKSAPLVGFLFSTLYMSWFTKFFFWKRKSLQSENIIGNLIDILTGVVYLSIVSSLFVYPLDYSIYRLQYASIMGQLDPFWFMEAGFIVLQGMFLYRIFELELKDEKLRGFITLCVYFHTATVLIYSSWELILKFKYKWSTNAIFAPFQDPHSYGGYVLILFFFFMYNIIIKKRNIIIEIILASALLYYIFLSGSAATVISALIVGIIGCVIALVRRKKNIPLVIFVMGIIIIGGLISEVTPQNRLALKYITRLNYHNVLKLETVTERFELWSQAIGIIKEFPLTGSGIGSYFKISNNYSKNESNSGEFRNAHNYYFQFAAELGIPALFLFFLILFFVYKEGLQITKNVPSKGLLLGVSAYLFSMLSGHHLLLSTQQFLFWFVLFAIVHPAGSGLKENRMQFAMKRLAPILYLLVFFVASGHAFNSLYLKKEVKGLYDYGLYKPQVVNGVEMRWTDQESRRKINAKTDYFEFSMYAEPENQPSGFLEMEIFVNDQLLDRVIWKKKDVKYRKYHISGIKGQFFIMRTRAGKSYNPYKRGISATISENRNQSVAVTDVAFISEDLFKKD